MSERRRRARVEVSCVGGVCVRACRLRAWSAVFRVHESSGEDVCCDLGVIREQARRRCAVCETRRCLCPLGRMSESESECICAVHEAEVVGEGAGVAGRVVGLGRVVRA